MSSDDPSMPAIVPAVVVPAVVASIPANSVAANEIDSSASQQPPRIANRIEPEGYSWIATNCWLIGSLAILVLAAVMSVGSERRVFCLAFRLRFLNSARCVRVSISIVQVAV